MDWANTTTEYPLKAGRPFDQTAKASIADTDAAIVRLIKRYPEFFASLQPPGTPPPKAESTIPTAHWELVARVQQFLRLAWDAPDLRTREWLIFKTRDQYYFHTVRLPLFEARVGPDPAAGNLSQQSDEEYAASIQAPPFVPFEQLMYRFQRMADLAFHCGNPECPAPYFFAKKKSQRFCSEDCSAPAKREAKRRWWRENRGKTTKGE